MSKKIRYILTIILTILIILYTKKIGIENSNFLIFLAIYLIYIILNIKDIIKKNNIKENKNYNILSIITFLIMIIVFSRALIDPSFIFNSIKFKYLMTIETETYVDEARYQIISYIIQNINYFIGLIIILLTYRKINMEKQQSKYNEITLICLFLSVISIIPTINCFTGDINPYKYLIFTIILLGTEIYFLIKDNNKKREWPIFISWFFNLFALISIIINIAIYN